MGRRKLEIKRIENKSSRLVSFSKRRTGLINKARKLAVVCDVDVAVIVISATGKLYEFGSSGCNSVAHILSRYEKSRLEPERKTTKGDSEELLQCTKTRTCKELLQAVDRLVEENKSKSKNNININNEEELSVAVTEMKQLEEELHAALVKARSRKTQLMMEYVSAVQEEGRNLNKENEEIEKEMRSGLLQFTRS